MNQEGIVKLISPSTVLERLATAMYPCGEPHGSHAGVRV